MNKSTKNVTSKVLVMSRTNFVTFSDVDKVNENRWKAFGFWYKSERELAGRTQEEVAEIAEMHPKTVSRIENGEPTKRPTVVALAKAINLDANLAIRNAFAPEREIKIPRPILDALARSGTFNETDSYFIADIIDLVEKRNQQERVIIPADAGIHPKELLYTEITDQREPLDDEQQPRHRQKRRA